ncbi:MAG: undecaprenyl-diphosphate phosphatase [Tissierellia bacterium]|nr:undecaprenyl-diphosphate phosphatase [Tissierellia bacterium]
MKLLILLLGFILIVSLLFYILSNLVKGVNVRTNRSQLIMWLKIIVACIPAGIVGVLFDDLIDKYLYNYVVVALALIIFGIFFIVIENKNKNQEPRVKTIDEITYKDALMIGLFQLLAAIFPGTSRSGATILGGIIIGLSRTIAAEFTFFLAVPVMLGASILKLAKFGLNFTMAEFIYLIVGMVVAFGVSIVVIKFLMNYIKKNDFKAFGWYRIILGVLVLVYFFIKTILL